MRVKIIERKYYLDLEDDVNEFLSECNPSDVIDIKYSGGGAIGAYSERHFSVMIILR